MWVRHEGWIWGATYYTTVYTIKSKDSVNLKTFVLLKPTKVTICVHFTAIIFLNILDRQNQIMLLMLIKCNELKKFHLLITK